MLERLRIHFTPEENFHDICTNTFGIHSARIQTPFVTYLSRFKSANYDDIFEEINIKHRLIKIRTFRGTLHTYRVSDAKLAHFATLKNRVKQCAYLAKGGDTSKLSTYKAHIQRRLDNNQFSSRQLEQAASRDGLISCKSDIQSYRIALKYLWEEGVLCLLDRDTRWNKENRAFALTQEVYGSIFATEIDELYAIEAILERYFKTFGPASKKDFCWWSGLSVRMADKIIEQRLKQGTLAEFESNGTRLFFEVGDPEMNTSLDNNILFLPWEETRLKAYFETRWRYIDPEYVSLAFNKIGEAVRTIFSNGKIIGTWVVDDQGIPSNFYVFAKYRNQSENVRLEFQEYRKLYEQQMALI